VLIKKEQKNEYYIMSLTLRDYMVKHFVYWVQDLVFESML